MNYEQKDLGYPRTKTHLVLAVEFSNGEVWEVPAQVVVDSRDEHYKEDKEDTGAWSDSNLDAELTDWASNNMNWSDLAPYAEKTESPPPLNYEDDWCNTEKYLVHNQRI